MTFTNKQVCDRLESFDLEDFQHLVNKMSHKTRERLSTALYQRRKAEDQSWSEAAPRPSQDVFELLSGGLKIRAVQVYRKEVGCSLRQAKMVVDKYESRGTRYA